MKKLLSALTAAVLPIVAVVGISAGSANAAALTLNNFNCDNNLYQISDGDGVQAKGGLYKYNVGTQIFSRLGSGAVSGINGLGRNPADGFLYAFAKPGSSNILYKITSAGEFITADFRATGGSAVGVTTGTVYTTGADFLPTPANNPWMLLTDGKGGFATFDVRTGSGSAISGVTNAVSSNKWGAADLTVSADGSTAYGMDAGKLDVFNIATKRVSVISTDTHLITHPFGTSFGAAYTDITGDLFFYANYTAASGGKAASGGYMYTIPASQLSNPNPVMTEFGGFSGLSGPNDGASCATSFSPLAPTVVTSADSRNYTSGSSVDLGGNVATGTQTGAVIAANGIQICYSDTNSQHLGSLDVHPTCVSPTPNSLAANSSTNVVATVSGLADGTYYFQVRATNTAPLTSYGLLEHFTIGIPQTTYTVTWDPNGGAGAPAIDQVTIGDSIQVRSDPTGPGLTFVGWFDDPDAGSQIVAPGGLFTPVSDVTVYAHWTSVPATNWIVSWDTNGGSANPADTSVTKTQSTVFPETPTQDGFTFSGWFDDPDLGSQVFAPFTPTSDITLYAHWTENTPAPAPYYNVYFTSQGVYVTQDGGNAGAGITCPPAPVRQGYKFISWGGACSAGGSYTVNGNATWDAIWEKTTVVVNFNSNGATVNSQTVTPGSVIDCPTAPTRAGYTFKGWPGCIDGKLTVTGATNIEAQWEKTSYPVTFTSNGEPVKTTSGTSGSVIDCPPALTRAGYTFIGWPGCVDGKYTVTGAATIAAQWIENLAPVPNPPAAGGGQTGHEAQPTTLLPNSDKDGLKLTAPGWTLDLIGQEGGVNVPLDTLGRIVFQEGHMAHTTGSGFKPNSDVHVYIFSTPILLGILHTDANGNFVGDLPLPAGLNVGDHTVQVDGYAPDNSVRTADVPVVYAASKPATLTKSVFFSPDSTVLSKYTVKKITSLVKGLPMGSTVVTAKIVGFVYPINSAAANKKISNGRANNIAALLRKLGLTGNFTVIGAGRDKVADPTARRVDVAITYTTLVTAP